MTFAKLSGQEPKKEETSSQKSRLPKSRMVSQEETMPPQPIARPRINIDLTQIPTLAPEPSPVLSNPLQMRQRSPQIQAKLIIGQQNDKYEQEAVHGKLALRERTKETTNSPIQAKEAETANKTGLPDRLKTGIEHLSGYSLDNVKVHYNSDKPARLRACAYAQGTDIHIAPGQEKHLPHETWHVVQQMQGRVKPTMQANGVAINDDRALEREADLMGVKAASVKRPDSFRSHE